MISRTQVIMGTFITISLEQKNQKYLENSFSLLKSIDSSISSYNPSANIYKLNSQHQTSLDTYTYEALLLSKKYYSKTNGYFDITVGSITKNLFRFGEEERVPTSKELSHATISIKDLLFTSKHASIKEGMKVDLGGMGKGFGVDNVVKYLKEKNITQGTIAASGDIRCLDRCKMQVQDPFSDGIIASFETLQTDTGISTSGNYNRYIESTKNNHLINPKEKIPQDKFVSITLVSTLASSDLDAYATAASVMPRVEAYRFLNSIDVGYIVLQSDGEMVYSNSLFNFVKKLSIKYTRKK